MPGHKFEAERAGHLDGRIRRFLAPAEGILADFEPRPDEIWAEVGAGTGYFVIPLSRMARKVYALDLNEKMLELLRQRLSESQSSTTGAAVDVEPMLSAENSLPLADGSVDAVLLAFVLHEVEEPALFLDEVARVTRGGGRLCIVEYTERGSFGPPKSHRLTKEQIDGFTDGAGFAPDRTLGWSRRLLGWRYFDLAGYEYRKLP